MDRNNQRQIYVVLLHPNEEKYYGELKKTFFEELGVPCQIIRLRTLAAHNKSALSCASKILLQINAKLGNPLWEVKRNANLFHGKRVMSGALSTSTGKGGTSFGFVGSINENCTQFYSECDIGIKRREKIPMDKLGKIFENWAKHFYRNSGKKAPDIIILYREGLSNPQILDNMRPEILELDKMVDKIKKRCECNPQSLVMTINKKINSRIFSSKSKEGKIINPPPGSVVC